MDITQAGFDLIMITGAVDGEVVDEEVAVAVEFLEQNFDGQSFDPDAELRFLSTLSPEGMLERFAEASAFLNKVCNMDDKKIMLDFILETIVADRKIAEEEKALFSSLTEFWGFDVSAYVEDFLERT